MISIAVLMTCYNRKDLTISCLKNLFLNNNQNYNLNIYLVDDGSSDGTSDEIRFLFPEVKIIKGNGSMYWNGGMRCAWKSVRNIENYDFFLWLNDDTMLNNNALDELLYCYNKVIKYDFDHIIVGACCDNNQKFSYGGKIDNMDIIPNGTIQKCKYINGNVVLVPKSIYNVLGNLSKAYTHSMGDIDYGLRAIENEFGCATTRNFIASCNRNEILDYENPKKTIYRRFKSLHAIKGLNMKEYIYFRKRFWPKIWFVYILKAYLKAISPSLYNKISNFK